MIEPNFLFLFFITMTVITLCLFIFFQGDILQPALLMTGSMTFSSLMAYIFMDKWGLPFSLDAYILLTIALCMFIFGSLFCSVKGFGRCKIKISFYNFRYEPRIWLSLLLIIIMAILAFFSFQEMYNLSVSLGNTEGYANIIKTIRPAIENQSLLLSRWMNYRQSIALAIASIFSYMFLFNVFYNRFKYIDLLLLFPIVMYIPFMILTTGRMAMMSFGIFFLVLGMLLYQKHKGYSKKSTCHLVVFFIGASIFFIIMFFFMGILTGKMATENHTFSMILAHYSGVSLSAFDKAIHSVYTNNGFIGSTTLLGLYRILGRIGISVPQVDIFLPFVNFNGIDTNVYTAEWRYYKDFGIFGMCAIMWIMGASYTFFYSCIKYSSFSAFFLILYSVIAFPLFLSSIDERFFLDLFGTAILYDILLILLFKYLIIDKSKKTINR